MGQFAPVPVLLHDSFLGAAVPSGDASEVFVGRSAEVQQRRLLGTGFDGVDALEVDTVSCSLDFVCSQVEEIQLAAAVFVGPTEVKSVAWLSKPLLRSWGTKARPFTLTCVLKARSRPFRFSRSVWLFVSTSNRQTPVSGTSTLVASRQQPRQLMVDCKDVAVCFFDFLTELRHHRRRQW